MINILQSESMEIISKVLSAYVGLCLCPSLQRLRNSATVMCAFGVKTEDLVSQGCAVTIQRHKEPFSRLHSIKATVTIIHKFCASLKKLLLKMTLKTFLNVFRILSKFDKRKKIIAIDSCKNYYTDKHTLLPDLTAGRFS